ncbi:amidase [Consotaella aegiceratis]|uniref:amidase n=1 Tax=Consotaella aegiceratis TaxID=3097961 RepID=UPI002F427067
MNFEDYASLDGLGLAGLVRSGATSASELRATALEFVTEANPGLNMMAEIFEKLPPIEQPAGRDAPFYGVPGAFKDIALYFEGLKYEFACELARGLRMKGTSVTAAQLAGAGFSLLGRTTTPELGIGCDTVSSMCGQTRNPRDLSRTPGGSSGGSAALVASGCVPVAHGSDSLGSLRIPAHCCGVIGLKPPRGLGSRAPGWGGFGDLSVNHVLTRSIRDSAAMLDVFTTADSGGMPSISAPGRGYLAGAEGPLPRLDIASIALTHASTSCDATVRAAEQWTICALKAAGHRVTEYHVDLSLDDLAEALAVVVACNQARAIRNIAHTMDREIRPDMLESAARACLDYEREIATTELFAALDRFNELSRRLNQLTETFDILMMPTCTQVAPPIGHLALEPHFQSGSARDGLNAAMRSALDFIYLCPAFNISGQPSLSFPLWPEGATLPVGMQFVASLTNSTTLLQLGRQLEQIAPLRAPARCTSGPSDEMERNDV